jgi:beta-lactamase regulating signal transducer with metallopeptidase domain
VGTFVEVGLWNGAAAAVLALVAAGVSRLCRRPALTHTLWLLVLLKLLTPPLVPFALPWLSENETGLSVEAVRSAPSPEPADLPPVDEAALPLAVQAGEEEAGVSERRPNPSPPAAVTFPWVSWAATASLAGSALWAAWVAIHVARFRRLLRLACRASEPLRTEAETLARRMGLRHCPEVWLVPGAVSPMVWALGRWPCLLFPSGLLGQLDGAGRAALLAHELAHVRRRDHWVRLLELAATGLYWWHPALWWARRELHEAEEQCCDAWGVWALGGDGGPYALALLQAVAFVSQARLPLPAGASGVGQVSHLKRRLAMIMQGNTSRSLSWAGLGAVLALGLLLPLFPARGQVEGPRPPQTQGSHDQQIEALKQAIKVLEEQKRKEAPVGFALQSGELVLDPQPRPGGNVKDLQTELQALDKAIATKTKELRELQDRAKMLQAKLKELDPRTGEPGRAAPDRGGFDRVPQQPPGRVEDLEKKLDRLQKELEELRRELRPGRMAPRSGDRFAPDQPRGPGGRPEMAPAAGGLQGPIGLPAGPGLAPPPAGDVPALPGGVPPGQGGSLPPGVGPGGGLPPATPPGGPGAGTPPPGRAARY